jgi:serine/threonine protein kinase KIN1/2
MATTSVLPTSVERPSSRRHQQSTPSRSSTRTKTSEYGVPPKSSEYGVPPRKPSSRHRAVGESSNNDETVNVAAQSSRRSSSKDRPHQSRTESSRSGHHHRSSHSRDTMATSVANGGGPAPIVSAQESRPQGKSGKSRTTIPAPSGTFVLGKTVSKFLTLSGLEPSLPKFPN